MSGSTERTGTITNFIERRRSTPVVIGGVVVGGDAPVVVQSMTNTDTADVASTTQQVAQLARAGSELVRITVDREDAAAAVPRIRDALAKSASIAVPLDPAAPWDGT